MNDLPLLESSDPRDQDHGEVFRSDNRHLPTYPMKSRERKVLYGALAAAAALAVAVMALSR